MTGAESVTLATAIVGIVVALTTLVVQTGRLITIAEHYMRELRSQNALQAKQVGKLTDAIAGNIPTKTEVVLPTVPGAESEAVSRGP